MLCPLTDVQHVLRRSGILLLRRSVGHRVLVRFINTHRPNSCDMWGTLYQHSRFAVPSWSKHKAMCGPGQFLFAFSVAVFSCTAGMLRVSLIVLIAHDGGPRLESFVSRQFCAPKLLPAPLKIYLPRSCERLNSIQRERLQIYHPPPVTCAPHLRLRMMDTKVCSSHWFMADSGVLTSSAFWICTSSRFVWIQVCS